MSDVPIPETRGTEEEEAALRDQIAKEKFGKPYSECQAEERMSVGGTVGGHRGGKKGGETRKAQLGHEGYSEMGRKGGYSTGLAHEPEEQKKHTDRTGNETGFD